MINQLIFTLCFVSAIILFAKNARQIYKNIKIGRALNRNDKPAERFKTMLLVAFGQKKCLSGLFPQYFTFSFISVFVLSI